MYESLITEVVVDKETKNDDGVLLEIRNVGDVLEFLLDGKEVFSGDWSGNFLEVFKRALELWDEKNEG